MRQRRHTSPYTTPASLSRAILVAHEREGEERFVLASRAVMRHSPRKLLRGYEWIKNENS